MRCFTDRVKEVVARQITDNDDVTGSIARVVCGSYLIIVLSDGRWACYDWRYDSGEDTTSYILTCLPDIVELHYAGLLTHAEYEEYRKQAVAHLTARYT